MAAASAEDLNQIIAANLRALRRKRNITLDEVAEATGVSKSMLGQIERGECGLSVATLWKISTGLKIPFTTLMNEQRLPAQIVDDRALTPLSNGQAGFRLYPIFPAETGRGVEILYIELDPGTESASDPHERGTEEFAMVYEGTLTLTAGETRYTVPPHHSIRYSGDQPHRYANHGAETVRLYMVIRYA